MEESAARISNEEVQALLEKNGKEGQLSVRPYDFAAQRINRTDLPLLEVVSKNFGDRAGASLSLLLGRDASLQFDSLESVKSVDLQASLPVPATLAVVRLKPLPGFAYVSVEPALLLTLLDGFFGGTGRANADPQAAVAPAAQRFLALMLRSFAADLAAAWQPVSPVELELVKQETNPRLVQLGGALESVIVAKYTVEFAARSGRIDWLLPDALLSPVREALAGDGGAAPLRKQEAWAPVITDALQEARLETRAVLAQAQISLRELVSLAPGDIIPIEAPQQVTLLAGDVALYRGRFGISQGHNALKILPGVPV
ncbi:MAG TPA: FliM/FliN family flagellar motor switch protein [Steroidobacteraceae bacterium]|jgi:flagellar motor switch protein FliM|nr:FliM/FliN family flagellar motor switch protein [Steroidobacteraceae bacterium]